MIILQTIAFFVLVWFVSMKVWNCCLAFSGKVTKEPQFIDVVIALAATTLYVTHVLM